MPIRLSDIDDDSKDTPTRLSDIKEVVDRSKLKGGAMAPANIEARKNQRQAEWNANPIIQTIQGLSDAANETGKLVPFGDKDMPHTARNFLGETGKLASFIPGVGPVAGGALYMGSQAMEDPNKSPGGIALQAGAGAAGGKALDVALPLATRGSKALLKGFVNLLPKPVEEKIYQLYNDAIKPRVGQFKTKGDLQSYKKDQIKSSVSINKNKENLTFEDPSTGEIYNSPRNKQDYLDAIDKTQKDIWKNKVESLSKGATEKGVLIDTEGVAKKSLSKIVNDKNMKLVEPQLVSEAQSLIDQAKVNGKQTPEEVEDLLTKLNNKSATYWANKNKNATNVYVDLASSLREEMEKKIEGALSEGGYLEARKEWGSLKRIKQDVLRSTANQIFRGDTTLGDKLLDTFAGEELVRGIMTMNPQSIITSGTTKSYQLLRQYLRNPDRKIKQMFQLLEKYKGVE